MKDTNNKEDFLAQEKKNYDKLKKKMAILQLDYEKLQIEWNQIQKVNDVKFKH